MKKILFLIALNLISFLSFCQKSVSITIDDVPKVRLYKSDNYTSNLLKKLDSLHLPVAIFINEENLTQTKDSAKNNELLKTWILKDYITVGNHGYSHQNYADVGFDAFKDDVLKGEILTKEILKGSGKKLDYFRFPFNSLGKDSLEHERMQQFLLAKNYISTPFTIESEDWLYAQLYDKAIADGNNKYASQVGEEYVKMSLKIFSYFDSLSISMYERSVKQIYLCHDNRLNTDYLPKLIQKLKAENYQFVSLEEAMRDPVYKSKDYYKGKAGFSWIYRWIENPAKRRIVMRGEPSNPEIQKAFEDLSKAK